MGRTRLVTKQFAPVKGMVTELSAMNNQPDFARDLDNVEVLIDGTVRRRLGMDVEPTGVLLGDGTDTPYTNTYITTSAMTAYLWKDATNTRNLNLVVVQVGTQLQIFRQSSTISTSRVAVVDFSAMAVSGSVLPSARSGMCEFHQACGVLVVVNKYCDPFYIQIDNLSAGTVSLHRIEIQIRAFDRLSTMAPDARSATLSHVHEFDLLNSGWRVPFPCANDVKGTGAVNRNPIAYTQEKLGYYPPTGAPFYALRLAAAEEAVALDTYSPWEIPKMIEGNTASISGHFITSAFYLSSLSLVALYYSAAADLATTDYVGGSGWSFSIWAAMHQVASLTDTDALASGEGAVIREEVSRPVAVAAHNGHVFYAGKDYNQNTVLFFSQLADSPDKLGKCYQSADPTAEEINDLVATDGGVIPIQGSGNILALADTAYGLVVFAANGIWRVTGRDAVGFSADSYDVQHVTSEGCVSQKSVVVAGRDVYYWARGGIVRLYNDEFGNLRSASITLQTIQSMYDGISESQRNNVQGIYDERANRVYWCVPSPTDDDFKMAQFGRWILVLDLKLSGFFQYTTSVQYQSTGPYLITPIFIGGITVEETLSLLTTTTGEVITETDGTTIIYNYLVEILNTGQIPDVKFFCAMETAPGAGTYRISFAQPWQLTFHDWGTFTGDTGFNYNSYVEFAYNYGAAEYTKDQTIYVHSFFSKRKGSGLGVGTPYEELLEQWVPGLQVGQSVLEYLTKPESVLRVGQSSLEYLTKSESSMYVGQSVLEYLIKTA